MGRKPDPHRKQQLLEAVAQYLLDNGLSDLSLRPLAAALGTSPRTLLYHFGSKEELIAQALRPEHQRQEGREAPAGAPESAEGELDAYWDWLSSPQSDPFMRLFFEVYGLALRDPDRFRGFLDSVVADWLALLEERARQEGVPAERARATATLLVATYRGLAFDLLATGDRERVQAAHLELKRWLRLAADDREADEGVESASDSP